MKYLFFLSLFFFSFSSVNPQDVTGKFTGKVTGYLNTGDGRQNFEVSEGEATLTIDENFFAELKYSYKTSTVTFNNSADKDPKYDISSYYTGEATLTGNAGTEKGTNIELKGTENSTSHSVTSGKSQSVSFTVSATCILQNIVYDSKRIIIRCEIRQNPKVIRGDYELACNLTGIGEVSRMVNLVFDRGTAKVIRKEGEEKPVGKGEYLRIGDKIITGPDTRMDLIFPDGAKFRLKSNTEVEIQNDALLLTLGEVTYRIVRTYDGFTLEIQDAIAGVSEYNKINSGLFDFKKTPFLRSGLISYVNSVYLTSDDFIEGSLIIDKTGSGEIQIFAGEMWLTHKKTKEKIKLKEGELLKLTKDGFSPKEEFNTSENKEKKELPSGEGLDSLVKTTSGKSLLSSYKIIIIAAVIFIGAVIVFLLFIRKKKLKV